MGKIEIYGIMASPPFRAILIVAKAIGVPYEVKELDPSNKTPEFKKLNPQQQIPVLVDDGLVLTESRAILQYLVDKYAKDDSLYPKDLKARALVNARLNFDCGTLWPRILSVFGKAFAEGKLTKEALQPINDSLQVVEEFLTREKWIAGPKVTLADVSFSAIICMLEGAEYDLTPYPKINEWLKECRKNIPNYSLHDEGIASSKERFEAMKKLIKSAN